MVKSYRGQEVDLNKIVKDQGDNMSLGNTKLNGRGDIVNHGTVVKSREERLQEWMASHKQTTSVNLAEDINSKKIEDELSKNTSFEDKRVARVKKNTEPNIEEKVEE